jgi:TonB family protein
MASDYLTTDEHKWTLMGRISSGFIGVHPWFSGWGNLTSSPRVSVFKESSEAWPQTHSTTDEPEWIQRVRLSSVFIGVHLWLLAPWWVKHFCDRWRFGVADSALRGERPPIPVRPNPKIEPTIAMNTASRSFLLTLTAILVAAAPFSAMGADAAPDRPAQAVATVAPNYPYLMRRAEAAAEITVSFNVNAKGLVTDPKVIDSTNPEFIAPTLEALKKWAFVPALKDGKPVDSRVVQTFTFNVRSDAEGTAATTQVAAKKSKR